MFGGLYLPHLREAIWRNLALAEGELRRSAPLEVEQLDLDGDGFEEIWIHAAAFSALVSPHRGGAIEEYTLFGAGINYADVLTRRREAYHELALEGVEQADTGPGDGTPSIHDIEKRVRLDQLPPVDRDARALFVERVLPGALTLDGYAGGDYQPIVSWAGIPVAVDVRTVGAAVEVTCRAPQLEKRIRCDAGGGLTVSYRWDAAAFPQDALFAPEVSLARPLELTCVPTADVWSFPVATVSKSERGLDETVQGHSLTPRWPVGLAEARVEITWSR